MAEIEVECFTGVKTAQNNKTEGRIERKACKCETEGRCAWGDFISRKTGKMHCETASKMTSLLWSQNNWKENVLPSVFYKMPDQGTS